MKQNPLHFFLFHIGQWFLVKALHLGPYLLSSYFAFVIISFSYHYYQFWIVRLKGLVALGCAVIFVAFAL